MEKYIVVLDKSINEFICKVNDKIKDGYTAVGGISTILVPNTIYLQSMILDDNTNDIKELIDSIDTRLIDIETAINKK